MSAAAHRPNILLVTTDHLRYDTLGYTGDPVIRTPAIDALAARSLRFERWFSQSPVCMPARATLMTGRYPQHHGVRWNFSALNENEVTLLEHFRRNGYTTASVGKHHVQQARFQASLDHVEAEGIRNMDTDNPFVRHWAERGHVYLTGPALPDFQRRLGAVPRPDQPEDCHLDAWVGRRAREYLKRRDTAKPFFLWLGFYGPHHPYVPSGRFATMYDPDEVPGFHRSESDLARKPPEYTAYIQTPRHKFHGFHTASERTFREMKAAYYGTVSQIDWQLGLVLESLVETGQDSDTIVVFTSDHGELLGDHGMPAKGPFLLDCMLRVPCLVRPAGAREGRTVMDLAESVDLFPTLCALAGMETPVWVQGRANAVGPREAVYAEAVDKQAYRKADWKLIRYTGRTYGELYDLRADPWELDNRWSDLPEVVGRLTDEARAHRESIEDFRHPTYARFDGVDSEGGPFTHYLTW